MGSTLLTAVAVVVATRTDPAIGQQNTVIVLVALWLLLMPITVLRAGLRESDAREARDS